MQIRIQDGVAELSGETILKKINFEVNTESKIGIVGRNGCGKTTLLKLLKGEINISNDYPNLNSQHIVSGKPTIGTLEQITFKDDSITLVNEIRSVYNDIITIKRELDDLQKDLEHNTDEEKILRYTTLLDYFTNIGGFYFEKEYEAAIKRFGFNDNDKNKSLSEFSGGQRTKIAFLKLLLSKPDLLILDEPTNHLDVDAVDWLEDYLSSYKKAVVIVSHDRMFLDKTVNIIYEIEYGKTNKYVGNYTDFIQQKQILREKQQAAYEEQQKEISELKELIERFRFKANKAAMVQSKIKYLERMEIIEPPEKYDSKQFYAEFEPDLRASKNVLVANKLKIGYESALTEVDFVIERGQHIGVIGGNGQGKSTLLKTIVGAIPCLDGDLMFGNNIKIGYFDQQMAQYSSEKSVLADFMDEFPLITTLEARNSLGAFLFSGDDVFKTVNVLSGGEKVRLALCKLFKKKPNFIILDEPTNHMDIIGKETLENILADYTGTLLVVSHDRYFINKVSQRIFSFENFRFNIYEHGYDEFIDKKSNSIADKSSSSSAASVIKKEKKTYTTPGKEKAKKERALKKAEETVFVLEDKLSKLNQEISKKENLSDYIKLTELQKEIIETEQLLLFAMKEWENLL